MIRWDDKCEKIYKVVNQHFSKCVWWDTSGLSRRCVEKQPFSWPREIAEWLVFIPSWRVSVAVWQMTPVFSDLSQRSVFIVSIRNSGVAWLGCLAGGQLLVVVRCWLRLATYSCQSLKAWLGLGDLPLRWLAHVTCRLPPSLGETSLPAPVKLSTGCLGILTTWPTSSRVSPSRESTVRPFMT